jgi:hypothetical protein
MLGVQGDSTAGGVTTLFVVKSCELVLDETAGGFPFHAFVKNPAAVLKLYSHVSVCTMAKVPSANRFTMILWPVRVAFGGLAACALGASTKLIARARQPMPNADMINVFFI